MKTTTQRYPGMKYVVTYGPDGSANYYPPVITTDSYFGLDVFNPGTTNGDFKSPNSFFWSSWDTYFMSGSVYSYYRESGKMIAQESGSLEYVPDRPVDENFDILYNQAVADLYDKCRGAIDLSVTLAQGGQVASMFRSANRTLQYIRSFKKLRLKEAYRDFMRDGPVGKKLGSKWLEFQYGWKPLAQDAYNTAVELGKQFPSMMVVKTQQGSHEVKDRKGGGVDGTFPGVSQWSCEKRVLAKARFRPSADVVNLLGNFTSLNPASIAWELTPYSFVVDWFVDFGGYMRSLESAMLMHSSFVDGFFTFSALNETHTYAHFVSKPSPEVNTFWSIDGRFYAKYFKRERMVTVPIPRPPVFNANLGSTRLLNAAALMSQHMR